MIAPPASRVGVKIMPRPATASAERVVELARLLQLLNPLDAQVAAASELVEGHPLSGRREEFLGAAQDRPLRAAAGSTRASFEQSTR